MAEKNLNYSSSEEDLKQFNKNLYLKPKFSKKEIKNQEKPIVNIPFFVLFLKLKNFFFFKQNIDQANGNSILDEIGFFNQKLMKRILVHLSEMLFEGSLIQKWKKTQLIWEKLFSGTNLRTIHNLNAKCKSLPFSTMNRRVNYY